MTAPDRGVPEQRRRGWLFERGLFVLSVVMLVASAALHPEQGGGPFVVAAVVCLGTVGAAWYRDEVSTREVLLFAIVARLLAFPLLPSLSDDGYRYLWDGWLQASGTNPFLYRPSDPALAGLHDSELYSRLNSAEYYSVYPPASQVVFWLGGMVQAMDWRLGWYVIKGVFVGVECLGLWAASRFVAPRALILYAWHPLVIIEGAGQGHTEVAMIGFLLLSLAAYRRRRPGGAVAALTVAGWFKLYPLALAPFLLRRVGWRYLAVAAVVSVGLLVPFVHPDVPSNVAASLDLYVRLFEFNAGPYYLLKMVGGWWTGEDVSKTLGPALRVAFVVGLAGLYALDRRHQRPLPWIWVLALGWLWATATTVHPWYLLGMLALLPFTIDESSGAGAWLHAAAWLWLSLGSMATYLFYTAAPSLYWAAVWIGWTGWAVLLALSGLMLGLPALMGRRGAAKWDWLRSYVGTPRRLLDLGAGEGFVGEQAARDTGAAVVLADVVDMNRTDLPLVLYDGRRLPFADDAFDATLLVFVLHHSEAPLSVLREVRRVTRGRVVVVESVVESRGDLIWLTFADRLANRLRSGGRMQEGDLHFGTVVAWREQFRAAGFDVVHDERRGRRLHKRHLFVLE